MNQVSPKPTSPLAYLSTGVAHDADILALGAAIHIAKTVEVPPDLPLDTQAEIIDAAAGTITFLERQMAAKQATTTAALLVKLRVIYEEFAEPGEESGPINDGPCGTHLLWSAVKDVECMVAPAHATASLAHLGSEVDALWKAAEKCKDDGHLDEIAGARHVFEDKIIEASTISASDIAMKIRMAYRLLKIQIEGAGAGLPSAADTDSSLRFLYSALRDLDLMASSGHRGAQ